MSTINRFEGQYNFLSNFFPSPWVMVDDITFDSVEKAYQASKTIISVEREKFLDPTLTCGMAKRLGREITLRANWEQIKLSIMEDLVRQKFSDYRLRTLLRDTFPVVLVEGNYWHDQFYGDCYCNKHDTTPGHNWLGKILMKVRDEP